MTLGRLGPLIILIGDAVKGPEWSLVGPLRGPQRSLLGPRKEPEESPVGALRKGGSMALIMALWGGGLIVITRPA